MGWTDIFLGMMITATTAFDNPRRGTTTRKVNKCEQSAKWAKDCMGFASPMKTYCEWMEIDPTCSDKVKEIESDILNNYITNSGHVVDKDYEKYLEDELKSVMKIIVYECQCKGEEPNFDLNKLPERLKNGDTALLLWAACFTRKIAAPSMMKYLGIEPYENGFYVKNNIVKENPNDEAIRISAMIFEILVLVLLDNALIKVVTKSSQLIIAVIIPLILWVLAIAIPIIIFIKNPTGRYDKKKHKMFKKKEAEIERIKAEEKKIESARIRSEEMKKEQNGENKDKSPLTDEFNCAIEYDKHKDEWKSDLR